MKSCLLVLLIMSVAWGDLTIPNDVLENGEYGVPEMKHRQVRSLTPEEKRKVLGTFSTRPFYNHYDPILHPNYYDVDIYMVGICEGFSAYETSFNDPFWKYQWYQHDCRVTAGPVLDHNIVPAQRMGYNGKGVSIGILGERLTKRLFDMQDKVKEIFNAMDGEIMDQRHGLVSNIATMVAGVIAMNANNSQCGAGIAYNADIMGITVMEFSEYEFDHIVNGLKYKMGDLDIYVDAIFRSHDGETMPFNQRIKNGLADIATMGRKNNGGIYVVGAGNGGNNEDNCGADFIANSIHTFVIGSATMFKQHALYGEQCSAIIATAYSSEDLDDGQLLGEIGAVTINGKECTKKFGGSAASAAIASGIFALSLQANPKLSLRDLMHVITMTTEKAPLYEKPGWKMNAAGFYVHPAYGFGLLNAENMVLTSLEWQPVPKMITCKLKFQKFGSIENGLTSTSTLKVDRCQSKDTKERVNNIEQVELITTISFFKRGGLSIWLISPKNTWSCLLYKRAKDTSTEGLNKWSMRSLHFWGESVPGQWMMVIYTEQKPLTDDNIGCISCIILKLSQNLIKASYGDQIRSAELVIHGTSELPKHWRTTSQNQRRAYSYSPDFNA